MSTRSLAVFENAEGKEIMVMYKHCDGNLENYGEELIAFIDSLSKEDFNGIECLIAQVIAKFKTGIGDIYIYPPGTRNMGEEYIYTVAERISGEVVVFIKDILKEKE